MDAVQDQARYDESRDLSRSGLSNNLNHDWNRRHSDSCYAIIDKRMNLQPLKRHLVKPI